MKFSIMERKMLLKPIIVFKAIILDIKKTLFFLKSCVKLWREFW